MRILPSVAFALALASPLVAQSDDMRAREAAGAARLVDRFPIGEVHVFDAKYGPLKLGRASLEVVGNDTVRGEATRHFRFELAANALGIIRMRDRFDSWVGIEDFRSRRLVQDYNEPSQKKINTYEIFPDSGYYTQSGIDTVMPTVDDPLDDWAFLYFARTLDREPGQRYEFNRYFRPDRNPVVIEVLARDTVEVPAGEFAAIMIHPIIKGGGIFKESADARMWITDDDRRLIVQVQSKFLGIGTITLRLTNVDGVLEQGTESSN
jgi:hypothetical protein